MVSPDILRRIEQVRENNFRLLRMFSLYVNERADFITTDMVDEVAKLGNLTKKEAFLLLFAESCGVHPTDGGEDSAFFNEYLAPSVRELSPSEFISDPYYAHIRFPDVNRDQWDLSHQTFKPYQTFIWDDTFPDRELRELPPLGFFSEPFQYPVILENGQEWMLVTPNEIQTTKPAVRAARGEVITFGLGLGYFPYLASLKEEVRGITIIEKDPAAIRLFQEYILPQFEQQEKIRLINADAFEFLEKDMGQTFYDFAYVDIWHDAGDGVPLYLKCNKYEKLFPETEFQYWIEDTMLSYLRWYDFDHMPGSVADPYKWLNNSNTGKRARDLPPEAYLDYRASSFIG